MTEYIGGGMENCCRYCFLHLLMFCCGWRRTVYPYSLKPALVWKMFIVALVEDHFRWNGRKHKCWYYSASCRIGWLKYKPVNIHGKQLRSDKFHFSIALQVVNYISPFWKQDVMKISETLSKKSYSHIMNVEKCLAIWLHQTSMTWSEQKLVQLTAVFNTILQHHFPG